MPEETWKPLVLTVAPNGARRTKADHPALPMTPEEIAETTAACVDAGAAMVHLHVRDEEGRHTLDVERYRAAIAAIRRAVGDRVIVQATTEAVGRYTPDEQMDMVRVLRPEAVSLAIRELLPDDEREIEVAAFLAWVEREGILPQYILYSAEDVKRYGTLLQRGVIPRASSFTLYVLGRHAKDQTSAPEELLPFLETGSGSWPWAVCAFGGRECACAALALCLGGHARVGFENNLLLPDGSEAPDNAALVAAVRTVAEAIARPVADSDVARSLMGSGT